MVGGASESRFSRIKKLNFDRDNFSPKEIICVDDFEVLSKVLKDESTSGEKLKLIRIKNRKMKT
ncbi:MAG: hypothetical protein KO464_04045 [Candidatus Methanofastidiosum sp.]|nr:hypothetical protein [Methanofastidiosum sp.]